MTISTTKKFAGIITAAGLMVALSACGAPPTETPAPSGDAGAPVDSNFKPCIVSDEGGWNDKSFNQSAKEGLDRIAGELGVETTELQSNSAADYAPNLQSLVDDGCTFVISVGYKLSADTIKSALANPEVQYAIIDDWADNTGGKNDKGEDIGDGVTDAPNIKPLMFDTAQAAYLGGYAAAAYSDASGVGLVGTFGGIPIPPVTIFMDGFQEGVAKYNEDKSKDVQSFGWDEKAQTGSFTGGFEANDTAKQTAQGILDQGVNVILPVGGPIYQSAAAAIGDKDIVMLGVDSDVAISDPTVADKILVSIMKRIDQSVYDAVKAASAGEFDVTAYIGTLENGGVGLSSFHEFESKLPAGLLDELKALEAKVVSGEITVTSPSSPKA